MDWIGDIQNELRDLRDAGLLRRLREVEPLEGARARVDGREAVLFCTNDYLGLAAHPEVKKGAREALDHGGAGARASRLVSGSFPIHRRLEEETAAFKGAEACLAFPTGFQANLGAVGALVGEGDEVYCDRLNHASLVDACRASGARLRVFAHRDPGSLENALKRSASKKRLILTDGLFSMDGDLAPLSELSSLAEKYGALWLVDDAHGTGTLGPGGRGAAHLLALPHPPEVVVGTYSKALGSVGGFVCGPQPFIELLLNRARSFLYTTGLPPSACGASRAALGLLGAHPEWAGQLEQKADRIRSGLRALGFELPGGPGPILPVPVGDNGMALAMSEKLLEEGVLVVAIRPPTVPKGTARLRVSVSLAHTEDDLKRLLGAFEKL